MITTSSVALEEEGEEEEEEGILLVSLANFIGCSMLAYHEGSLLPDVLLYQFCCCSSFSSLCFVNSFVDLVLCMILI
jgi:hypothetical protein